MVNKIKIEFFFGNFQSHCQNMSSILTYAVLTERPLEELQALFPRVAHLLPFHNKGHAQRSIGWILERDSMLTCSDFAAALGEDSCKSAQRLFRQKTNQETLLRTGFNSVEQFLTSEGNRQEDMVRKFYEALDPDENMPVFDKFGCMRHSDTPNRPANEAKHTWLGGSPDGIVGGSARLIEIKNAITRSMIEGGVPIKYFPQVQGLMEVFNLEECDYIEYHSARTLSEADTWQVIRVKRDRNWWALALPKLQSFWEKVIEYRRALRDVANAAWALWLREFNETKPKATTFVKWPEYQRYAKSLRKLGPAYKLRRRNKVEVEGEPEPEYLANENKRKRTYDNSHHNKCDV